MEVANPQRMGDAVPLVNPTRFRSDDNPSGPPKRIRPRPINNLNRLAEITQPFTGNLDFNRSYRARIASPIRHASGRNRTAKISLLPLQERVMGIEPTPPAWKAGALPLSYTRKNT